MKTAARSSTASPMRIPPRSWASVRNVTSFMKRACITPPPMAAFRIPGAVWVLVKDVARHVLRRPVIGIVAAGRTRDGRWLLIRRGDTGEWALPGGTLEWGETLRDSVV